MKQGRVSFENFLLLDGATGSNLIAAGLPAGVCVEQWILENPQVLTQLQQEFLQAGTQVLTAPTFGANPQKLSSFGLAENTKEWNQQLATLSKELAGDALIAGDLSPTGLFLQPMGNATFEDLCNIYRPQVAALKQAGVHLLLIETQMTLADARAALLCAKEAELPAFVTITLEQGGKTLTGLSLEVALVVLQAMGAQAVGLNCSCGPVSMGEALEKARDYAKVPLIAKPNAGEAGNPLSAQEFGKAAALLSQKGAVILGGCCGTTPAHIAALKQELSGYSPLPCVAKEEEFLANERQLFSIPHPIVSQTFPCDQDLTDNLMDREEDTNLVILTLSSPEDAQVLPEALPFCSLPICFSSASTTALAAALGAYQGRAMIMGPGTTPTLCQDFGAMIYNP